jgi:hypothetical protein
MPQSKIKAPRTGPPVEGVVTMHQLKAERAKGRSGFKTIKDVADWLGIPEEVLENAVHKAFLEMVNEETWLTFPLMFQQVDTMSRRE